MSFEEDTQNSAPGMLSAAQASKLGASRKGPDAQSTTKRSVYPTFIPVANDHLFTVLHYHHLRSSITSFEASY